MGYSSEGPGDNVCMAQSYGVLFVGYPMACWSDITSVPGSSTACRSQLRPTKPRQGRFLKYSEAFSTSFSRSSSPFKSHYRPFPTIIALLDNFPCPTFLDFTSSRHSHSYRSCNIPRMAASSSSELVSSEWSEWEWDVEHQCYQRYCDGPGNSHGFSPGLFIRFLTPRRWTRS